MQSVYGSRAWQSVRVLVLARDRWSCRIRLPGCEGRAVAVDHIVELADGGAPFDPANLQAACTSCNSAKGNMRRGARLRGGSGGVRRW